MATKNLLVLKTQLIQILLMQFDFPLFPYERFQTCQSIYHLREIIQSELIDVGLERKCKYLMTYSSQKFLYARCSRCTAFLRYKLKTIDDDRSCYVLKKYKSHHVHKIGVSTKKQLTIQLINNLPQGIQPLNMKAYITKTLNVSSFTFYSALRQFQENKRGINFRTLLPYLQQRGYVVFEPFPIEKVLFFPQLLLCITQNMKQAYLKYGRFIGIDFTYNLIREKPYVGSDQMNMEGQKKKKPKNWITGVISGLDSARTLQIFGLAFCFSESADSIQKILVNFFQIMGKQCNTIISDGSLGIQQAIKRLKSKNIFNGFHLLDAYHAMANLKVQYKNLNILRQLYLAADEEQYYDIFEKQVVHMEPNQQRKFGKFDSISNRFCLSKIPVTFVGLGSSSSMSQKINDIIKTSIPRQTSFSQVITKIMKVSDKINKNQSAIKYETYPFENILLTPWIKDMRITLNKYVFRRLIAQVFKAVQLDYNYCHSLCTENSDNKILCECKFQEKTGLPCKHIIKVLLMNRKMIIHQVDQYWIISNRQEVQHIRNQMLSIGIRKIRRGRPRQTRRNRRR